jgi:ubiquinone/menaquinone biosynthesis C-methylase UbiE
MMMDNSELKKLYKKTFDTVADGYGHHSMRFFAKSAREVLSYLKVDGNQQFLDVATGTGYVALTIAKTLPEVHVTGIDFSEGMLAQATKSKSEQGLENVTFVEMDMQAIDYPDNYFDAAVSAFSIFFVEDMKKQLIHIAGKVKDSGQILMTTFYENAFVPLVNLFIDRIETYGVKVPELGWKRVATPEQCTSILKEVGLQNLKCEQKQCGYYLRDAADWWYIIWNAGFRGLVGQLSQNDLEKFKTEHLAEVEELKTDQGIWLEMSVLYTVGEKTYQDDHL